MIDTLFIGLSVGSILLLVALGLAITYGVMGVIALAFSTACFQRKTWK